MSRFVFLAVLVSILSISAALKAQPSVYEDYYSQLYAEQRAYFSSYMNSARLMPITLHTYLSTDQEITALNGVSLAVWRTTVTGFARQGAPKPSVMYGFGVLDNIIALQGNLSGKDGFGYSVDYLALNGGYTIPLLDYKAYFSLGARTALSYQPIVHPEITALNTDYTFVHDFKETDGGERSIEQSPFLGYSGDVYAKAGYQVSKNWYVSGALGLRLTSDIKGKWYLKSDVEAWKEGTQFFEPDEWILDELPKKNTFLGGSTLYLSLSLSPYY